MSRRITLTIVALALLLPTVISGGSQDLVAYPALSPQPNGNTVALEFSPDGEKLLVSSTGQPYFYVYHFNNATSMWELQTHRNEWQKEVDLHSYELGWHPNSQSFCVVDYSTPYYFHWYTWDGTEYNQTATQSAPTSKNGAASCDWTYDGAATIYQHRNGDFDLILWDNSTGSYCCGGEEETGPNQGDGLFVRPNSNQFISSTYAEYSGTIRFRLYEHIGPSTGLVNYPVITLPGGTYETEHFEYHPDGDYLVVTTSVTPLAVILRHNSDNTFSLVSTFGTAEEDLSFNQASFSPDGTVLALCGVRAPYVTFWAFDVETGLITGQYESPATMPNGAQQSCDFSPAGFRFATGGTGTLDLLVYNGTLGTYIPPPPPRALFGDNGAIYGQSRQAMADAMGIEPGSVDFLYAAIVALGLSLLGFRFGGTYGAIGGSVGGVVIVTALGWVPIWLPLMALVMGAATVKHFNLGGD